VKEFKIIRMQDPKEAMQLPQVQILVGKPLMLCNGVTDNGPVHTGFWSSTAGTFKWIYPNDEVIHILEGEAWLSMPAQVPGHQPLAWRVVAGDSVHFPANSEAIWAVHKYVRKFWVLSDAKRLSPIEWAKALLRRLWPREPETAHRSSSLLA
jgi:uncharacterized cupin superfamily protein